MYPSARDGRPARSVNLVPRISLVSLTRATGPELVAYGTFLNADAQRIIAKRIILTGHPFKVHKKTATVRYMFFNPVEYLMWIFLLSNPPLTELGCR